MKEKLLLVVTEAEDLTTTFQGYDARQIVDGVWLVKTNDAPRDFFGRIRSKIDAATNYAIFPFDQSILHSAIVNQSDLVSWATTSKVA